MPRTRVSETVASTPSQRSLLAELGLFGMDAIEPLILAGLVTEEPILLIGEHGAGKSLLFVRLADALGLTFRHYNASLLNYDDLVGYPLPDGNGGLEYVQTPATVWGSQAVFIDEISRCRPDMQNKLFPIIHEKRVQGLALDRLIYRWSAMNPPAGDEDESIYLGSEALDAALADRFAFLITMPDWRTFCEQDQERVILAGNAPPYETAAGELRALVAAARDLVPGIRDLHGPQLAVYVRTLTSLLERSGVICSARRAGMLLRNIIAVHAVRHVQDPNASLSDSAFLALGASLPDPASGVAPKPLAVHAAHREAWRMAGIEGNDALRLLLAERDPLRRALRAIQLQDLSRAELSGVVADALAALPLGARHALATEIFTRGAAGRLVAAVAEQCADLYAAVTTAQHVHESVAARSGRHTLWQHVVDVLSQLNPAECGNIYLSNLITGLFSSDDLATRDDLEKVIATWHSARGELAAVA